MRYKKSFSLVEVIVAVAIFSALSVALFLLLRSGIRIRERIETSQDISLNIHLGLDKLGREIRNIIDFKENDPDYHILSGSSQDLSFYTLGLSYPSQTPKIMHVSYAFQEGKLIRAVREPLEEEPKEIFSIIDNIKNGNFFYATGSLEPEGAWGEMWDSKVDLPKGVKIEINYNDIKGKEHTVKKYVYINK
ncbi:MAG: type II secretion system protein GspJ [Candidatus Omnitrophota bacterium]